MKRYACLFNKSWLTEPQMEITSPLPTQPLRVYNLCLNPRGPMLLGMQSFSDWEGTQVGPGTTFHPEIQQYLHWMGCLSTVNSVPVRIRFCCQMYCNHVGWVLLSDEPWETLIPRALGTRSLWTRIRAWELTQTRSEWLSSQNIIWSTETWGNLENGLEAYRGNTIS